MRIHKHTKPLLEIFHQDPSSQYLVWLRYHKSKIGTLLLYRWVYDDTLPRLYLYRQGKIKGSIQIHHDRLFQSHLWGDDVLILEGSLADAMESLLKRFGAPLEDIEAHIRDQKILDPWAYDKKQGYEQYQVEGRRVFQITPVEHAGKILYELRHQERLATICPSVEEAKKASRWLALSQGYNVPSWDMPLKGS